MAPKKLTAAVFIGGFTETAMSSTGMERIRNEMHALYDHLPNAEISEVYDWDSNWKAIASRLQREGFRHVIIFGYSWGGGWGAQALSKQLIKRGIEVIGQVLCDAVYRPAFPAWKILHLLSFRSLTPAIASITVPDAVKSVKGIRQDNVLPMGHRIKWRRETLEMHLIQRETVSHTNIDDSPEWKQLVRSTLKELMA